MGIMIYRDKKSAGAAAAMMIAAKIIEKPGAVIGIGAFTAAAQVYEQLAAFSASGMLDWSESIVFQASELVGKSLGGAQGKYLDKHLYRPVKLSSARIFAPRHYSNDIEQACNDYEDKLLEHGNMDVLLLHLGRNGHIAFNGPSRDFSAYTHAEVLPQSAVDECAELGASALDHTQAIAMGISNIMSAKKIILLALGRDLSSMVSRALSSSITPSVPASILQAHPAVTYILDEGAAAEL